MGASKRRGTSLRESDGTTEISGIRKLAPTPLQTASGFSSGPSTVLNRQAPSLCDQITILEDDIERLKAQLMINSLGIQLNLPTKTITRIFTPRRRSSVHINTPTFESLLRSIESLGQLSPAYVRPIGDGNFELIAGLRRFEVAKRLNRPLYCFAKEMSDLEALDLLHIDNWH